MRVLAVDPGKVRVGLAVTDPDGLIAGPLTVIPRQRAAEEIAKRAAELGVELVVVGLPLNMDASEGPSAADARRLAQRIAAGGLAVEMQDERLTSVTAERALIEAGHSREKRRALTDAVAATVLLEAYLARRRNRTDTPEAG